MELDTAVPDGTVENGAVPELNAVPEDAMEVTAVPMLEVALVYGGKPVELEAAVPDGPVEIGAVPPVEIETAVPDDATEMGTVPDVDEVPLLYGGKPVDDGSTVPEDAVESRTVPVLTIVVALLNGTLPDTVDVTTETVPELAIVILPKEENPDEAVKLPLAGIVDEVAVPVTGPVELVKRAVPEESVTEPDGEKALPVDESGDVPVPEGGMVEFPNGAVPDEIEAVPRPLETEIGAVPEIVALPLRVLGDTVIEPLPGRLDDDVIFLYRVSGACFSLSLPVHTRWLWGMWKRKSD